MDPIELAGSALLVGIPGPDLDDGTRVRLSALGPAGIVLFRRNLDDLRRLGNLLAAVHATLEPPILVAIDQEGGRVSRLEPWIGATPSAARIARAGADAAYRFARATGQVLKAIGVNVDFAPVVDLCPAEADNGIGDRSFGVDPTVVTHLAGSYVEGLRRAGVAACLKHFPGLGDTSVDSHVAMPTVRRDAAVLSRLDLAPFRDLASRAPSVMVGHAHYPGLGVIDGTPACLAREVVEGLLRTDLAYGGLIVSDDLEMGAVRDLDVDGRAAVTAIAAGCDLLLYCADLDRATAARDALVHAADDSAAFARRLTDAARHVRRMASRWPARRTDPTAWDAARARLTEAVATIDRAAGRA